MRTALALAAMAWFLGAAVWIGDGVALADTGVMAVHRVGRIILIGLALLAASFVDWRAVWRRAWDWTGGVGRY